MKISEIISDNCDLLADVVEAEEKQEPCKDCISRQAVLDIVTEQERLAKDRVRDTAPSLGKGLYTWVNPVYTRYSAQLSERSQFKTMIQTLPPVNPQQPKTGHWIGDGNYICSCCKRDPLDFLEPCGLDGGSYMDTPMKYCPNCGARMVEPQEGGDQE